MESTKRHLLNIPVQVRRQILGYLTHEVQSRWRWNYWPWSGSASVATNHVHNMPSLDFLLSCDRLYEESLAFSDIHHPTVGIDLTLDDSCTYMTESVRDQSMNGYILPRMTSATINIAARPGRQLHDRMWFNIGVLSKALAVRSPRLATIQVVAKDPIRPSEAQSCQNKVFTGSENSASFLASHPAVLADLPLQRHPNQIQVQAKTFAGHKLDEVVIGGLSTPNVRPQEVTREWTYRATRT